MMDHNVFGCFFVVVFNLKHLSVMNSKLVLSLHGQSLEWTTVERLLWLEIVKLSCMLFLSCISN